MTDRVPRVLLRGEETDGHLALVELTGRGQPPLHRHDFDETFYILGGETDIAYANGMDDFKRITHVPAFLGNLVGVGHGGTYWQPNGGKAAAAVVAWLEWQLRGDETAAKKFTGKDCGLCKDPAWQFAANRIDTSLGQFPGPVQVWEQVQNLSAEHRRERDKAAEFYQRQEERKDVFRREGFHEAASRWNQAGACPPPLSARASGTEPGRPRRQEHRRRCLPPSEAARAGALRRGASCRGACWRATGPDPGSCRAHRDARAAPGDPPHERRVLEVPRPAADRAIGLDRRSIGYNSRDFDYVRAARGAGR